MTEEPTISTHVLDTGAGRPAAGVEVQLFLEGDAGARLVGTGATDADGRIRRLLHGRLVAGEYRIEFRVGGEFFRHAALTFRVSDTSRSYHVPLLIAPYSVASYRGS